MTESFTLDIDESPTQPLFTPSPYQEAIFSWIDTDSGDAIVNAVAGSGKTTTLVEASKRIKGNGLFCAFNAHIVAELKQRLGDGMEARTIHSLGLEAVREHLGTEPKVEGNKYQSLAREAAVSLCGSGGNHKEVADLLIELVNLCQCTLSSEDTDEFNAMVKQYGVEIPTGWSGDLQEAVRSVLRRGQEQAKQAHLISFTDMLWLPYVWNLQPRTFDWVFVDECQDLNRAQLELVLKMRGRHDDGRMIFVGDPFQGIYAFAGADAHSYRNIAERTAATEFPLSVCYRCSMLVVREAQRIVPDIQSRPYAPLGTVRWIGEGKFYEDVQVGDLVLCRLNAPLITACLTFIQQKVPARIRGRDIGKYLTGIVNKVSREPGFRLKEFTAFLRAYTAAQVSKLPPDSENALTKLYDCEAALEACFLASEAQTVAEFTREIERLFSDEREGVYLSTVHKAKGLESKRVFILAPEMLPMKRRGQQPWELEQEMNLKYVAVTRAQEELVFVKGGAE
jgi:DNA helicase-2/ATP-dependent DNA helicase PcrA